MSEITSLDDPTGSPHAEVFSDAPRTVRLSLDAGESVPEHSHPDSDVLIHVLSGVVELGLDDETHRLESGDLIRFDGDRTVSPHAVEESTALVVFAPRT